VQRQRPGQRARLALQQLEVVVQPGADGEALDESLVPRDRLAVGDDLDLARADPGEHAPAGERDRHRVAVLAHRDERLAVDAHLRELVAVERLGGHGPQQRPLPGQRLADRLAAARDRAPEVGLAAGADQRLQLGQRGDLRHRHEVVAAEAPHLALDTALLVRTLQPGERERRLNR
jgi:hypothetical protein